ncbi:MAG: T9SS type A sorting domain-containing protein [Bacteroidetes bacterium]|nr:MAG: T9SS type A sorting domain-containing protein [Bacteroidota bacterium]
MYRQQKNEFVTSTFRIFPNPAYDQVNVNYMIGEEQKAYLLIQNSLGQSLQQNLLLGSKNDLNLNIQMLANGIYTVQMVLENEIIQQEKLVILR